MPSQYTWEKVNDTEYRLMYGDIMCGWLVLRCDGKWYCRLHNDDYDMRFGVMFEGMRNPEQALWQATLWINETCNQVANSFHRIRDNMPSIGEMYNAYEAAERRTNEQLHGAMRNS